METLEVIQVHGSSSAAVIDFFTAWPLTEPIYLLGQVSAKACLGDQPDELAGVYKSNSFGRETTTV
ncbi:MAG: hypothetical protein ACLP00_18605 [Terracidiphilus sp.]